MAKLLIIGGAGMLGSMLARELSGGHEIAVTLHGGESYGLEKYGLVHKNVDALNESLLGDLIKKTKPDFILNCVGVIKQIVKDAEAENIIAVNALLPHKLLKLAKETGASLVHFSTDCVFSGAKGPYAETDKPDIPAGDIYGATKLLGEINDSSALTLRTSIIGPELKGKHSLLEWAFSKKNQTIEGYKNALYSGVTTLEMAKIIDMLIRDFPDLSGLWHVGGPAISKYDLLILINKIFNLNITVKENTTISCDRRLDSTAFQKKTGYRLKPWEKSLQELKEVYA